MSAGDLILVSQVEILWFQTDLPAVCEGHLEPCKHGRRPDGANRVQAKAVLAKSVDYISKTLPC